jgi:hypothetical protein
MKKLRALSVSVLVAALMFALFSFQESPVPWDASQMVYPADLAQTLNDANAKKPVIICVGPVEKIKTALQTEHPASSLAGMEDLKYLLTKFSKTQEIILYCGCCKMKTCPNIKPAFEYLRDNGYKNAKVLYLPSNLDDNWKDLGYPMEGK